MSARGTGRATEPSPDEDPNLPPFTDPATWAEWQKREIPLALKDLQDLHFSLAETQRHPRAMFCPCRLAQRLRAAYGRQA